MEGGDLSEVGIGLVERRLRVPDLERAANPDHQGLGADPRAAAHHRRKHHGAVVAEADILDKAEDPPQPLRARPGRLDFLGDPPALAVLVEHAGIAGIIGKEAWIAFVAADQERP